MYAQTDNIYDRIKWKFVFHFILSYVNVPVPLSRLSAWAKTERLNEDIIVDRIAHKLQQNILY